MIDIDAIRRKWLNVCGACDAGIGECSHPAEDYRPVMASLVEEVKRLRADPLDEIDEILQSIIPLSPVLPGTDKVQNPTKEKAMTQTETVRTRALELALAANAAGGGALTSEQVVDMADQFERYINKGKKSEGGPEAS